jgi:anti-sigma factor RsiW
MHDHARDPELSREESLWLDGRLDQASARRLEAELAKDPARRARLEAWHEAMDLWRDDAVHLAEGLDTRHLADQVLAGRGLRAEGDARSARRYAAAAVLLIGVGLAGASALGPRRAEASRVPLEAGLERIERDRLELQIAREWATFPVVHTTDLEEER